MRKRGNEGVVEGILLKITLTDQLSQVAFMTHNLSHFLVWEICQPLILYLPAIPINQHFLVLAMRFSKLPVAWLRDRMWRDSWKLISR